MATPPGRRIPQTPLNTPNVGATDLPTNDDISKSSLTAALANLPTDSPKLASSPQLSGSPLAARRGGPVPSTTPFNTPASDTSGGKSSSLGLQSLPTASPGSAAANNGSTSFPGVPNNTPSTSIANSQAPSSDTLLERPSTNLSDVGGALGELADANDDERLASRKMHLYSTSPPTNAGPDLSGRELPNSDTNTPPKAGSAPPKASNIARQPSGTTPIRLDDDPTPPESRRLYLDPKPEKFNALPQEANNNPYRQKARKRYVAPPQMGGPALPSNPTAPVGGIGGGGSENWWKGDSDGGNLGTIRREKSRKLGTRDALARLARVTGLASGRAVEPASSSKEFYYDEGRGMWLERDASGGEGGSSSGGGAAVGLLDRPLWPADDGALLGIALLLAFAFLCLFACVVIYLFW